MRILFILLLALIVSASCSKYFVHIPRHFKSICYDGEKQKWYKCEPSPSLYTTNRCDHCVQFYVYDSIECTLLEFPEGKVFVDFYYPNDTIK